MSELLKDIAEMCRYYGDDCERNGKHCPLEDNFVCAHLPSDWNDDTIAEAEKIVEEWRNPKYPTWEWWLLKNGYITPQFSDFDPVPTNVIHVCLLTEKARERIPRDIAEKLNIDPIE